MAIQALNSAATGLRALSTQIDVIANNLANAETNAFKSSRVNFEDLMYQEIRPPGTVNQAGDISPSGISVGLGVKISNTQLNLDPGPLENTGRQLDIAISNGAGNGGNGFFHIKILSTISDGTGYTRNGNFFINTNNELVLGMGDGYSLVPPIKIPNDVTNIAISQDGIITGTKAGSTTNVNIGQLKLTQFVNPQGLKNEGGSIYTETPASGKPIESNPGENGVGQTLQGYLEGSNVDPVKELVTLIKTQRSFELNSQSIQTADQALQTVANLRRF